MTSVVPDILARIVETKREEIVRTSAHRAALERIAGERRGTQRGFRRALAGKPIAIIAEIKKASPSKGTFTEDFDPAAIATLYEGAGAACLSVLTDERYFRGGLRDLEAARNATGLPAIRKDFIIDRVQIAEAAAHGADAILLIAAILDVRTMQSLREYAESLGIDVLVEAHDAEELRAALDSGATLVGVNNRNLHTFAVTLETSLALAPMFPSGVLRVSESGIQSRADVQLLRAAGYSAFLIGERLMKAGDPAAALRELLS